MANVGANDYKFPPLGEVTIGRQVPVVPQPMTDIEIRATFSIWPKP